MAVFTLSAIVGVIGGGFAWLGSLPPEFKYILFLGGLLVDHGVIAGVFGFEQGIIGGAVTFIMQGFVQGIVISSFELLVIFTMLPLIGLLIKSSLSR